MRRAKTRILSLLLAVMLCCSVSPASAFADGGTGDGGVLEYWSQSGKPQQAAQQTVQQSGQTDQEPAAQQTAQQGEPISQGSEFSTRDLLYDKDTHKQFITVEGRNGNTFYIVIDYDAPTNDKEEQYKTYFLNKVDEADLSALLEEGDPVTCSCSQRCVVGAINTACPLCAANMTECVGKDPEPVQPVDPEPDTDPEPEQKSPISVDGILTVVLAVALAGAGVVYFLKLRKKKPNVKGNTDLDDYDYGDEENEYDAAEDSFENEEDE
ncbi:MAG: DUF4366 domain-containing protein [Oscillospiraceae bacterium]|nr:DUF4366 domain-containing protein [Oscillospiraceae bacterium]